MIRTLALIGLLCSCLPACARQAAPAVAPAAAPAAAAASANATAAVQPDAQAAAAQESTGDAGSDDRGDTKLERLAALPADQQLPAGKWKPGVNYKPIVPAQPTSVAAGKVEVLEVFWYGCPHCYALEPFLQSWLKNKADYIEFVRSPVMWGPVHRAHARLYYTLEALGRRDLHAKVFTTIHEDHNMLVGNDDDSTLKLQLAFAQANGISNEEFMKAYNSFVVNSDLQKAEEITLRYRIEGVPEIIVNGKYSTDVGMAGGHAELISLINDLAASEKRH